MKWLIWILRLFGLGSWAAGLETKIAVDQQEAINHETGIAHNVENEKLSMDGVSDDKLDDELDKLRHDAETRADKDTNTGSSSS